MVDATHEARAATDSRELIRWCSAVGDEDKLASALSCFSTSRTRIRL